MKNNISPDNCSCIKQTLDGTVLNIYVQPKSSKNMISGLHNNALKIKVMAPPVDGAANKMCIKYLSKVLGIPKSSLSIISGESSRLKKILIDNIIEIEKIRTIIKK